MTKKTPSNRFTPFFLYRITPGVIGIFFWIIIFLRNIILILLFSFNFSPDSSLYIQLGRDLFHTWYISPLVTFPYPLLNALAVSYRSPYFLLCLQAIITSIAGGFFVYVVAKHSRLSSVLIGVLLSCDLVWGAVSRSILTDSLLAAFFLACIGILLNHYDRRRSIGLGEMFISGIIYGLTLLFRPANVFLAILIVPLYVFLVRSWKRLTMLILGGALVFLLGGSINLAGSGNFYILSNKDSYTSTYTAFPLFVYKLFSPENGPRSFELGQYLSQCYPGVDLQSRVDRSEGGAVDSVNNMDLIKKGIITCVKSVSANPATAQTIFPRAYMESFLHNPVKFATIIYQENAVFFRYNDPYILGWLLDARNNYGCIDIPWCENIGFSHSVWSSKTWYYSLYGKVATKIIQAYLIPVGLISALVPEKNYLPFNIAWFGMVMLLILVTRGRERLLVLVTFVILQYTSITVVLGFGFTERYAAMMTPLQSVLSGMLYTVLARRIYQIYIAKHNARSGGCLGFSGPVNSKGSNPLIRDR